MMDILYRSKTPAYKGQATRPAQGRPGFLSGLWCYLFGGGASRQAYRTRDGNRSTAPVVSRCWWGLTPAPQYKTQPEVTSDPEPEGAPCDGEPLAEDCPCDEDPRDEGPRVMREIHIYPAE